MRTYLRTWLGLAALGAALLHLAVAAGSPPLTMVVFAVLGVVELAWAIAALVRLAVPVPRLALVGALVPVVVWAAFALVLPGGHHAAGAESVGGLPFVPLAAASALDLLVAVVLALGLRRPGIIAADHRTPPALPYLAALAIGAFAMVAVTLPALGETAAGRAAMTQHDDGGH